MIDEEKIKAATDVVFADVPNPKANICMSAGFIRGIEWFKEAIWHDASEKPQGTTAILYQWHDEEGSMDVGIDGIFDDLEWKHFVEFNRIDKWCYIEDILPKGGNK